MIIIYIGDYFLVALKVKHITERINKKKQEMAINNFNECYY